MKLRAVDPLLLEISGSKIVVSSPHARKRLRVGTHVASLLLRAREPVDLAGDATVNRLVEAGFLVEETAEAPSPWREWGATAWSFHQRTRDTDFVVAQPDRMAAYREKLATRARPRSTRPSTSDSILLLPRVRSRMDVSFRDVLEGRRTHRTFTGESITLDAFSDMLHYSFAPLRFADAAEMGVLQLRAAASGGARHETEAFVFVFRVTGVEPGLYHYDPIRHGLTPIAGEAGPEVLEHLTNDQGFFARSAFGVLMVAVADRMSWKYAHPAAYKILLHNVGHAAQVFSMTAAALGLGAALTGAIRNTEADTLLGLDQPREFTTFALACGVPIRNSDGLPPDIRYSRFATPVA